MPPGHEPSRFQAIPSPSGKQLIEARGALLTTSGNCTDEVAQFRSRGDEPRSAARKMLKAFSKGGNFLGEGLGEERLAVF